MRNGVQTVDRALQLLQAFESPEQELGVTELAGALGVHKSTASRLAATLAPAETNWQPERLPYNV